MKLEIVTGIAEVELVSRRTNACFICPRKNEAVVICGKRYYVREVVHIYERDDETLKIFVEEE